MSTPSDDVHCHGARQRQAYTTARPDICALVPAQAHQVLDVGCSNGEVGLALMRRNPACEVDGIERNQALAEEAASRLRRVACADAEGFDWNAWNPGRQYDCIVFADVLEHLADPLATLTQARRRLTEEGCIVVSLPNVRHVSALLSIFAGGTFPRRPRGLFDQTHLRWFTLTDADRLLAEAGFHREQRILSLRWGDTGGGRMNRLLNRLPRTIQEFAPLREFLTYQVSLRARRV
ncbi:MAG TPA: class I SAM-dependent methyltransferase [Rubrivivax sp.]|nr:class I SAM-dependent methyltransferase [Rubrivivax sp.]